MNEYPRRNWAARITVTTLIAPCYLFGECPLIDGTFLDKLALFPVLWIGLFLGVCMVWEGFRSLGEKDSKEADERHCEYMKAKERMKQRREQMERCREQKKCQDIVTKDGIVLGYAIDRNVYTSSGILRGRIDCVEYPHYKSVHFCAPFGEFLNRAKLTSDGDQYIISAWG